ncbi:zinc finger HIT domain-containing protein 2 [Anopheles aquasalis]|uniref:zinc finger HIT domain-containing protein 2 n=1 Tax=Anopheles aquasalis TaxID=42839 RepID=UPI00215B1F7F|nr:zinc finger HIT domain-containing protein 2 [Anopheles aquasalis]
MEGTAENCKICADKTAKYNCPRCNILYCSVACYRSPNHLECSEGFYRENIVEELALRKSEDDAAQSARSMMEILQRIEQQADDDDDDDEEDMDHGEEDGNLDSDDDEQEADLTARLNGIDLNDTEKVWEHLTNAEKEEFQRMLENGEIMSMVPEVEMWWTKPYKIDLIQPLDSRSLQEQHLLSSCPPVWGKIADFKQICKSEPSAAVRFNIANVLAGYCFVFSYFFGDLHDNALEVVDCLLGVCLNLKTSANFDSEVMAVESVVNECRQERLPIERMTTASLKSYVHTLFLGPSECGTNFKKHFILAALSDVRSLLSEARKEHKQYLASAKDAKENVTDLRHATSQNLHSCQKKVEFYLAYAKSDYCV